MKIFTALKKTVTSIVQIDLSGKTGRSIANYAIIIATVCGMIFNWQYGQLNGVDQFDKNLISSIGLSADVIKMLGLSAIVAAFVKGHYGKSFVMTMLYALCITWGLSSALGFATHTRNNAVAEREAENKQLKRDIDKHANLESMVNSFKQKDVFKNSEFCLSPKTNVQSSECHTYWIIASQLDSQEAIIRGAFIKESDPQAATIAELLSLIGYNTKKEDVSKALMVFMAVTVELISAFGTFGFSPSRMKSKRKRKNSWVSWKRSKGIIVKSPVQYASGVNNIKPIRLSKNGKRLGRPPKALNG